jgi:hypothetical protein
VRVTVLSVGGLDHVTDRIIRLRGDNVLAKALPPIAFQRRIRRDADVTVVVVGLAGTDGLDEPSASS